MVLSAAGPRFGASEAYFPLMLLLWSDPIRPLGKGPAAGGEAHKIYIVIVMNMLMFLSSNLYMYTHGGVRNNNNNAGAVLQRRPEK